LARFGLDEDELADFPGSDRGKLTIAAEVHANAAVSMLWIAQRLHMRCAANVSQHLNGEIGIAIKLRRAVKHDPSGMSGRLSVKSSHV
jgi:hypothetical protein